MRVLDWRPLLWNRLDSVAEVAQALTIRAIPLAPNKVEGLALLRGNIINAINGRVCMGVEGRPPQGSFSYIVTQRAGETIAIGVDRVEDIVEVSPEQFSPPPSTLPNDQQALVDGAYLLEKKLLSALKSRRARLHSAGQARIHASAQDTAQEQI